MVTICREIIQLMLADYSACSLTFVLSDSCFVEAEYKAHHPPSAPANYNRLRSVSLKLITVDHYEERIILYVFLSSF